MHQLASDLVTIHLVLAMLEGDAMKVVDGGAGGPESLAGAAGVGEPLGDSLATRASDRERDAVAQRVQGGAGGPPPRPGPAPGRFASAIALKGSVRRSGRWRVPERYTAVVYKGGGWLDLRAAELSGPVTTFLAVAYRYTRRGVAYKGAVEITTRPPERPALRR
jgi:hypothetical protein